jgi:uncharacterized membrane protein
MSLKKLLQGNWLGHPLHSAIVHLPTGLWPAALVFDLVSLRGSDVAGKCATWALAVGLVAALAAAPTGIADWWDIKPEKPAKKIGWWHLALNLMVVALIAVSVILRLTTDRVSTAAVMLCGVANILLAISGYLGTRMVFEYGVSIARTSKKEWRTIAEAGQARLPAE